MQKQWPHETVCRPGRGPCEDMMSDSMTAGENPGRLLTILLWISLVAGCGIAIVSLIEEICLARACRDTLSFTFFGISLGWVGIVYFGTLLTVLALRRRLPVLELLLASLVFAGVGAEFRLLWIQKFIIGAWCPFCVSIAGTVFTAAVLLFLDTLRVARARVQSVKYVVGWLGVMLPMSVLGLAVAYLFIRQLA